MTMSRGTLLLLAICPLSSCGIPASELPIETSAGFTNFSRTLYAAFAVRTQTDKDKTIGFALSPLLAPGATHRVRWLDLTGEPCPSAIDLRVLLYQRVNHELPIGQDPGEAVELSPVVAGEVADLPACGVQTLETYTIVNWDTPPGTARVKIAQDTAVDQAIRASGRFANIDAAWEATGVDPALADVLPPPPAPLRPLAGRVTLASGAGVEGVGVLVRTRFRVRLNDDDPTNDPDAGFGDPIDFDLTDSSGSFAFARPAGAYQIEFFSDDFAFRPAVLELEGPSDAIVVIAEPLP